MLKGPPGHEKKGGGYTLDYQGLVKYLLEAREENTKKGAEARRVLWAALPLISCNVVPSSSL
jgi:hypothetical protein